mmetsp:Transcript_48138/g.87043  ORF Transcript_48138/g.87043 Transcript_48138/m.87043 type:complete len:132 (+) Transcript_48138:44-439(+)
MSLVLSDAVAAAGEAAQDVAGLMDRALAVSERRREALGRLAETRKKVRELGTVLSQQEAMLHDLDTGSSTLSEGYAHADGAERLKPAAATSEHCAEAVPEQSLPGNAHHVRRPLPRLRGNYPSRAEAGISG